ncbi:MAG: outer membrane lipoprotein LolB, partial [Gammaproteobacteria bacterium]
MFRILLVLGVALLSACAGPQTYHTAPVDNGLWQQHKQQVAQLQRWHLSGKVAVMTDEDSGQADLFWDQRAEKDYDIKLIAPFGAGTMLLEGREQGVLLTTTEGEQIFEQSADALLHRMNGWRFPVSGLRYWLLGVPAPGSQARLLNWNEQGYLYLLEQDGWRVEMRNYKPFEHNQLPG